MGMDAAPEHASRPAISPMGVISQARPRTKASLQSEVKFKARLIELGATLVEAEWLGCHTPHHVRCAAGHDRYPRPGDVIKGDGICRICAGTDPATAAANFRRALDSLGATL